MQAARPEEGLGVRHLVRADGSVVRSHPATASTSPEEQHVEACVKSPTSKNSTPLAAALDAAGRAGIPIVCTGRGASLAVADALAAALRLRGRAAFAVGEVEVESLPPDWFVCCVSRSGWRPRRRVDVLVCEAACEEGGLVGTWVPVTTKYEPAQAWFPLRYLRAAIVALGRETGLGEHLNSGLDVDGATHAILAVEGDAHPAVRVVAAATAKLGNLDLTVSGAADIGHGLHARIHAAPSGHTVYGISLAAARPRLDALESWCCTTGTRFVSVRLSVSDPALVPFAVLSIALDAIDARCRARRIDPARNPLPKAVDVLRDVGRPGSAS